jgi:hypothetical protein
MLKAVGLRANPKMSAVPNQNGAGGQRGGDFYA